MKTIEFIFDFGSPNAYLAHKVLPAIAARLGATVVAVPCLLGGIFKATGNQAPMVAFGPIKGKMEYEMLEMRRFIRKHDLGKFTMNPHFPVNTLMLMRGAVAAQEDGRLADYMDAGFLHMWEEPKKMDDPEVYVAAMTASGFDGAALLERGQTPSVKATLMENTSNAVDRGVFGIPTFFAGGEMYFGKDRLGQMGEAMAALG